MRRYAAKVDQNKKDIVDALRYVGASPESIARSGGGGGVPDLVIGYRRKNFLQEIKREPKKGEVFSSDVALSESQAKWHHQWHGWPVDTVRNPTESLRAIGVPAEEIERALVFLERRRGKVRPKAAPREIFTEEAKHWLREKP